MYDYSKERFDALKQVIACDIRLVTEQAEKMHEDDRASYMPAVVALIAIAEQTITEAFYIAYKANKERSESNEAGSSTQD